MTADGWVFTCDEVRERFALVLDNEGTAGDRAAVLAHVETCADCAAEWRAFRAAAERVRPAPTPPTDAERAALLEAAAPILEELRRVPADRPAPRAAAPPRAIRFAFTAAAAAVLFFLVFEFTGPREAKLRSADVVLYDDRGAADASFTAATFSMSR